jgi:C4-type Zn-finger protein
MDGMAVEIFEYECPNCGHVCTEEDMASDVFFFSEIDGTEGEAYCNHVCPKCNFWYNLDEWKKLE